MISHNNRNQHTENILVNFVDKESLGDQKRNREAEELRNQRVGVHH